MMLCYVQRFHAREDSCPQFRYRLSRNLRRLPRCCVNYVAVNHQQQQFTNATLPFTTLLHPHPFLSQFLIYKISSSKSTARCAWLSSHRFIDTGYPVVFSPPDRIIGDFSSLLQQRETPKIGRPEDPGHCLIWNQGTTIQHPEGGGRGKSASKANRQPYGHFTKSMRKNQGLTVC